MGYLLDEYRAANAVAIGNIVPYQDWLLSTRTAMFNKPEPTEKDIADSHNVFMLHADLRAVLKEKWGRPHFVFQSEFKFHGYRHILENSLVVYVLTAKTKGTCYEVVWNQMNRDLSLYDLKEGDPTSTIIVDTLKKFMVEKMFPILPPFGPRTQKGKP